MTRPVSLIALAAVVAFISFSASWVTSQPVWLTIVLVTHNSHLAQHMPRQLRMHDGVLSAVEEEQRDRRSELVAGDR